MTIERFSAERFRCLTEFEFEPGPSFNLVYGANASGKTSLLEALAYLGRGKSFRGASVTELIQHGTRDFVLRGTVASDGRSVRMGVRNSREGLEVRIDGETAGGAAALVDALPLQVIDPAVHDLVAGGPDQRRRFLDWLTFHVEHGYATVWRQFRRALKQRNAVLKTEPASAALAPWDAEFAALAARVDEARGRAFQTARAALSARADELLDGAVDFEYRRGWPEDASLEQTLQDNHRRDLASGSSQFGPQRADLALRFDARVARRLVSRGQQKLLASALIFGSVETVQQTLGRRLLLLLDDPAAELDTDSIQRLMTAAVSLDCQIVATSLQRDALAMPPETRVFHVEHGRLMSPEDRL